MDRRFGYRLLHAKDLPLLDKWQRDRLTRGFRFAVIDGSDGSALEMFKTPARAHAVADRYEKKFPEKTPALCNAYLAPLAVPIRQR